MTAKIQCKCCGKMVDVEVADDYMPLGDPYKLFKLLVCNRCGDYSDKASRLRGHIRRACVLLIQAGASEVEGLREKLRPTLESLLKRYLTLHAGWVGGEADDLDPIIVDALLRSPGQWQDILLRMKKLVRTPQKELL
jgi:hypothetical protein